MKVPFDKNSRIYELVVAIRDKYSDDFFDSFEEDCQQHPLIKGAYEVYNSALMSLDPESWTTLKAKAIAHYPGHRQGQRKQDFFCHLNEAFAYEYLQRIADPGSIKFVPEGTERSPDLEYTLGGRIYYCDVKTLAISNEEIRRRETFRVFDTTEYRVLPDGFLNKFLLKTNDASDQIRTYSKLHESNSHGIVYMILDFDDFTCTYLEEYKIQLSEFAKRQKLGKLEFFDGGYKASAVIHLPRYWDVASVREGRE